MSVTPMDSACRETWDLWDLCKMVKWLSLRHLSWKTFAYGRDFFWNKATSRSQTLSRKALHQMLLGSPFFWLVSCCMAFGTIGTSSNRKWGGLSRHSQQVPWEGEISDDFSHDSTMRRCCESIHSGLVRFRTIYLWQIILERPAEDNWEIMRNLVPRA